MIMPRYVPKLRGHELSPQLAAGPRLTTSPAQPERSRSCAFELCPHAPSPPTSWSSRTSAEPCGNRGGVDSGDICIS